MGAEETVLSLQIGKSALNFLAFICRREIQNQAAVSSLLILLVTDTLITGFLLSLWLTGWQLSLSLDKVSLRFLCFQNEMYHCVSLLLPWVSLSEEWCRSRMYRLGCLAGAERTLSLQASLLSLTCWLVAASYGSHLFSEVAAGAAECAPWEWNCLMASLRQVGRSDWLLPCIGAVLGAVLCANISCSGLHPPDSALERAGGPSHSSLSPLLLGLGAVVSLWVLPPFLAVNTWLFLALDALCGLIRAPPHAPLSAVHSVQVL